MGESSRIGVNANKTGATSPRVEEQVFPDMPRCLSAFPVAQDVFVRDWDQAKSRRIGFGHKHLAHVLPYLNALLPDLTLQHQSAKQRIQIAAIQMRQLATSVNAA